MQVHNAGGTLLEVCVGARLEWKDPAHPFRHEPHLQLSCIPTVMRWKHGAAVRRLDRDLEAADSPEAVLALVSSFVAVDANKGQ